MRKLFVYSSCIIVVLILVSCTNTESAAAENEAASVVVVEPSVEPSVELIPETDSEYSRSTAELTEEISYDTFQTDKIEILTIIAELDEIMKTGNYNLWKEYIVPSSISYWSNRNNLQVLSIKLASKNIKISNLGEYFINMFIPSRMDHVVNEIRYISPTEVKAVQVQGDTDILYYQFSKIDAKWLIELPTL